jgi:hypothetical protein
MADSKVYLGVSYAQVDEKFSNLEAESSSDAIKVKAGYGDREAYAIELSIELVKNESTIFSTEKKDGDKNSLNIELVKAYDLDIFVLPYLKAGFGTGVLDIQRDEQKDLSFGSFNFEVGAFVPVNDHLDFEIGYNFKNMSYENISNESTDDDLQYKSNVYTLYIGFNTRF